MNFSHDAKIAAELAAIAAHARLELILTSTRRAVLAKTQVYAAGYGSIARPMVDWLAKLGVKRFVLVDPKSYSERSVATQCEPSEVGRLKVEVGAERLRRCGVEVNPLARDIYECPDGLVADNAVVVVSADNRRADIGANRLASRMRSRLVKVNIEPRFDLVSARSYDFRAGTTICCECQFTEQMYRNQRHPNSCDAAVERRTAAPRRLSEAAGAAAALVVAQLTDEDSARQWFGSQWLWTLGQEPQRSELTPRPACRWDHQRRWANLVRLPSGPQHITLLRLLELANAHTDTTAQLRFCQQVATRFGCDRCARPTERVLWVNQPDRVGVRCQCGGLLRPTPYWTYREIPASRLRPVFHQPLADWGVQPYAVIEVAGANGSRSFVLDEGVRQQTL